MQKPISKTLPADLPENWKINDAVSPEGTDVGLSEKHGYNYQSTQINEAQKAINLLNEAFANVQEILSSLEASTTLADTDTIPAIVETTNAQKKVTLTTLKTYIQNALTNIFAAKSHTHGRVTNDGKIGTATGKVVMTGNAGALQASDAVPIAAGGTGATTAEGARTNLGAASKATIKAATMLASAWSNGTYSFESSYPASTHDLEIALNSTAISEQAEAFNSAQIVGSATSNVVKAYGVAPTVDIPIILKVVKK